MEWSGQAPLPNGRGSVRERKELLEDFVGEEDAAIGEAEEVAVALQKAGVEESADGVLETTPLGTVGADTTGEAESDEEILVGSGGFGVAATAGEVVVDGLAVLGSRHGVEGVGIGAETDVGV